MTLSSELSPRRSIGIKTNETVGGHEKAPVATGTFVGLHRAVSKAEILLRVLEKRLDAPPHSVGANHVFGRCVDLVRSEVFDWVVLVFLRFFLGHDQLHVSQMGVEKLLRPDVVGVVFNVTFSRVDALLMSERSFVSPFS